MEGREELLEYGLVLRTGERIVVAELDPERSASDGWQETLKAAAPASDHFTLAPREAVEAAKSGDTRPLEEHMGAPPSGCLAKASLLCSESGACVSFRPSQCRTSESSVRPVRKAVSKPRDPEKAVRKTPPDRRSLPLCWQWSCPVRSAGPVVTAAVHAWADGRHVILVSDDARPLRRALRRA